MEIEKSYTKTKTGYFCSITSNVYDKSFSHVCALANEVTREFDVNPQDMQVVVLGGMRRKGMIAVEFATTQEPSQEWLLVDKLDPHK